MNGFSRGSTDQVRGRTGRNGWDARQRRCDERGRRNRVEVALGRVRRILPLEDGIRGGFCSSRLRRDYGTIPIALFGTPAIAMDLCKSLAGLRRSHPRESGGVKCDGRSYEWVISVRAVVRGDVMTDDWLELPPALLHETNHRILNEVNGREVSEKRPRPKGGARTLLITFATLHMKRKRSLAAATEEGDAAEAEKGE